MPTLDRVYFTSIYFSMKCLLFTPGLLAAMFLIFASALFAGDPKIGMTKDALIAELGNPKSTMSVGSQTVLTWDAWMVTLNNGMVAKVVKPTAPNKYVTSTETIDYSPSPDAPFKMQESLSEVSFSGMYQGEIGLELWNLEYWIDRDEPYAIIFVQRNYIGETKDIRFRLTREGCGQLESALRTAKKWTASAKQDNLRGIEKPLGIIEGNTAYFSSLESGACSVWMGVNSSPKKAVVSFPERAIDLILGMLDRRHELETRGKALALERQEAKQRADRILVK